MIIDQLLTRICSLVPDPDCDTKGDELDSVVWRDVRQRPTQSQLLAVDVALILSKQAKSEAIRAAFSVAAALPVLVDGINWSGGFDSAMKMDAAKRMAQLAGFNSVALFDANNVEHVLTIAAAEAVILAVGADYQAKFAAKQALMVAVDAATSQAELDAVSVGF